MINELIPSLNPPSDGLDRLRQRLQSRPRRPVHAVLAGLAAGAVVITLLLVPERSPQDAFERELRQIVESARIPTLGVDGQPAQARFRDDASIVVYLVNQPAPETVRDNGG